MDRIFASLTFALYACALMAGCGGGNAPTAVAAAGRIEQSRIGRSTNSQTLYVSSFAGVAAFDTGTYNLERTYGSSQGLNEPDGLAQDASGNLYVANPRDNNVIEFTAGTTTPLQTLSTGMKYPFGLGFDPSGNLYVLNAGAAGTGADVTVYSPAGKLLRTISKGISNPIALAIDSAGNLYVANQGATT